MFSSERYRARAAEYVELAKATASPSDIREYKDRERSFTTLADNEEWLKDNFDKMVHAPDKDGAEGDALAAEEEHILRCLGAGSSCSGTAFPGSFSGSCSTTRAPWVTCWARRH